MQNFPGYGNISVRIVSAHLTLDKKYFGKIECIVKITVGSNKFETETAMNEGISPIWRQTFKYQAKGETTMHIELWDKKFSDEPDEFIAEGDVELRKCYQQPKTTVWLNLTRKGKPCGRANIYWEFSGQGVGNTGQKGLNTSEVMSDDEMPNNSGGKPAQRTPNNFKDGGMPAQGIQNNFGGGMSAQTMPNNFGNGGLPAQGITNNFGGGGMPAQHMQTNFGGGGMPPQGTQTNFGGGGVPSQRMPNNFGGMSQPQQGGYPLTMPNPVYSNMAGMGQAMNMGIGGFGGLPPGFQQAMMGGQPPQQQLNYPPPPSQASAHTNPASSPSAEILNNADSVFDLFDRTRSGHLNQADTAQAINYIYGQNRLRPPSQEDINYFIGPFDHDRDGRLNKYEFKQALKAMLDVNNLQF